MVLDQYAPLIDAAAVRHAVPGAWIRAVIMTESSGNARAYRAEPQIGDASYGLMQLLYRTARGLGYGGSPAGLYDPAVNIDLGSKLLGQLRAQHSDFRAVYSAYNSGSGSHYLTNPIVAANVARAERWLATFSPAIGLGLIVLGIVVWRLWQ